MPPRSQGRPHSETRRHAGSSLALSTRIKLSQDLDLEGGFGAIIGNGIMALPGGDDAPDGDVVVTSVEELGFMIA